MTLAVLGASRADFTFQIVGFTNPKMQSALQSIEGNQVPEISFADENKAHLQGICFGVDIPIDLHNIPMRAAVMCPVQYLEDYVVSAIYGMIRSLEKFEKVLDT